MGGHRDPIQEGAVQVTDHDEAPVDQPGVGDVRAVIDEAEAIAQGAAKYEIPATTEHVDPTQEVTQAFVVFTNPSDGSWVAAGLHGTAEIAAPGGGTATIKASRDSNLSDLVAGCSVVQSDITAIKAGQRTLEAMNAHAQAMMQQQQAAAVMQRLAQEGKGGRLLGGQN